MKNTKTTLAASRSHQRMVMALENAVIAHQELADAYAENKLPLACEATRTQVDDFKRRLERAKRPKQGLDMRHGEMLKKEQIHWRGIEKFGYDPTP